MALRELLVFAVSGAVNKSFNRYLIFFVIVAVGLVVSWGQVGKNTTQAVTDLNAIFLAPEKGCLPTQQPCAAFGKDQAVVLGPHSNGLMLKYQNSLGLVADLEAQYLDRESKPTNEVMLIKKTAKNVWLIASSEQAAQVTAIRLRLSTAEGNAVTEFAL